MRIEQEITRDIKALGRVTVNLNTLPALAKRQLSSAELTPLYREAKKGLSTLSRIDEVKDIADKHSAIAHYAKQIQDKSLLYYAQRVYARAIERIGELLAEVKTPSERKKITQQYGLRASDAQNAIATASLPKRARDVLIERDPPATAAELAAAAARLRAANKPTGRQREGFRRYVEYCEPFGKAKYALSITADGLTDGGDHEHSEWLDPRQLASKLTKDEARVLRPLLVRVIEWFDSFEQALPK